MLATIPGRHTKRRNKMNRTELARVYDETVGQVIIIRAFVPSEYTGQDGRFSIGHNLSLTVCTQEQEHRYNIKLSVARIEKELRLLALKQAHEENNRKLTKDARRSIERRLTKIQAGKQRRTIDMTYITRMEKLLRKNPTIDEARIYSDEGFVANCYNYSSGIFSVEYTAAHGISVEHSSAGGGQKRCTKVTHKIDVPLNSSYFEYFEGLSKK